MIRATARGARDQRRNNGGDGGRGGAAQFGMGTVDVPLIVSLVPTESGVDDGTKPLCSSE